ncbi:MAG: hypothetical protein QME62_10960 [Armatimonadota bacterium]|nr:hypothetical protein [Armatimonadota bacterium]
MASLLEKYRATQRRIRALFAPYTAELCPVCPQPCCRKPTKVRELDVLLANASGFQLPSANKIVADYVETSINIIAGKNLDEQIAEPCDYLGKDGCIFPDDLRPFECVKYVCPQLKSAMTPNEIRELRNLLHKLGVHHRAIIDAVMPSRRRRY